MSTFPILYVSDVARAARFYEAAFGFELCIYVDDVDGTAERLLGLGARQVKAVGEMPWGERMAYFDDLDGHRLHVTSPA